MPVSHALAVPLERREYLKLTLDPSFDRALDRHIPS
jgi:hypothetical protein